MPLYHLVGALDPLTDADVVDRLDDQPAQLDGEALELGVALGRQAHSGILLLLIATS